MLKFWDNTIILSVYLLSLIVSFVVFGISSPNLDIIGILSTGAIMSTFGSALITAAIIIEQGKSERVKESIEILYKDILKKAQWKRWPFLKRKSYDNLLDQSGFAYEIQNPIEIFTINEKRTINVYIPTVKEDFFDLPIFRKYILMTFYRKRFLTHIFGFTSKQSRVKHNTSYEKYMCILDILKSIVILRTSRYVKHFSIGLVSGSVLFTIIAIRLHWILGILL